MYKLPFHEITKILHDWMLQQPNVKEESITDWLLFMLSQRCKRIKHHAFSRHEESRNGADWEWWILTKRYAYRFRVQAKRLKTEGDNYASIGYSNNNGMQIELFMNSAKEDFAYPLYMLYSTDMHDGSKASENLSDPTICKMIDWCRTCVCGGFLSSAPMVYDKIFSNARSYTSAEYLLSISIKMSSLDIVLASSNEQDLDENIDYELGRLNKHYLHQIQHENNSYRGDHGFRYDYNDNLTNRGGHSVPRWVLCIAGDGWNGVRLPEWFESEYKEQLPHVLGAAVIDLRR